MGSWSNTCSSSIRWTQGPRLTALSSQPSPGREGEGQISRRAQRPRGIPRSPYLTQRPSASPWQPGPCARVPTCANEQHCIGGSIKPHDPVRHQVSEVGVLLYKQGPAPARPHLLFHQRVFLDEVEGVVGQLQRTAVAMVPVPIVDALGVEVGEEWSAHGNGTGVRAAARPSLDNSPHPAVGWVWGQYRDPTSGTARGTPCRDPRTPSGSLPIGTRRWPTGPHHPCHSKGGTPRVRVGAHFTPAQDKRGKAGPGTKRLWAHTT